MSEYVDDRATKPPSGYQQWLQRKPIRAIKSVVLDIDAYRAHSERIEQIYWCGKTWAVTKFGIERLDGEFSIPADGLATNPGRLLPKVINERLPDTDIDEFATCWLVALTLHRKANDVRLDNLLMMFRELPPIKST